MNDNKAQLIRYITELRRRLLRCLWVLLGVLMILLYFSNQTYTWLALPLLKHLPAQHGLIATNVTASFFVPFQLTWNIALFVCMPFFLYQLWAFIAPALYQRERKLIWPLLLLSIVLFYLGIAFAYFVIFPLLFVFLTHSAPVGVMVSPDMSQYLDFTLQLFFIFGLIFEVPIITVLLVWTGITTRETLINIRPYIIVGAFIVGMLFAPPDVLSQTMLAIPLWLLFELGLLGARFIVTERESYDVQRS